MKRKPVHYLVKWEEPRVLLFRVRIWEKFFDFTCGLREQIEKALVSVKKFFFLRVIADFALTVIGTVAFSAAILFGVCYGSITGVCVVFEKRESAEDNPRWEQTRAAIGATGMIFFLLIDRTWGRAFRRYSEWREERNNADEEITRSAEECKGREKAERDIMAIA